MRRMVIFVAVVACAFGLSACDLITEYITETESVTATESKTWNTNDSNFLEVDSSVLSVNVTGNLGGKTLYYATVNPDSTTISYNSLRKIDSSTLVSNSSSVGPTRPHTSLSSTIDAASISGRKHFVGEKLPSLKHNRLARSALSSPVYDASAVETYTVGSKKDIYIDTNASMSTYEQKPATLRAKGTYCYVWVVNSYYDETGASGNKVDTTIAKAYAEAFDKMYPVITHVFGTESDKIIYDVQALVGITTQSDTGKMINIVVYDIGNDYTVDSTGKESNGGVVGYFYAKDYYKTVNPTYLLQQPILGKSNVGKYFYIDSGYANSNFNDTISTLAHEFQHMVNFNQKEIRFEEESIEADSPDTSYNEMLSMLCEDMMQDFLELEPSESPKARIQSFNAYYFYSGIREYLEDSNAALSYSTSYAFGAWLCRQYGGAALVKEIMSNDYTNNDSLVAAVNAHNGTKYTFSDLFQQFVQALYGSQTYTLNKDATQTIRYTSDTLSYTYPMTAINIFSEDDLYSPKAIRNYSSQLGNAAYAKYNFNGPFLFNNNVYKVDLRPSYGIQLHGVGAYPSGTTTDTIVFSETGSKALKIYLIIQ